MTAKYEIVAEPNARSRTRGRLALWAVIALLLLLPLAAMQFTREVAWTGFDFAAATVLLVGGGVAYEGAARLAGSARRRVAAGAAILGVIMLVWAHGGIGVF